MDKRIMVLLRDNLEKIAYKTAEFRCTNVPVLPTPGKEILSDPKTLFSFLCRYTIPHGCEDTHYGSMLKNLGFTSDSYGNWFKIVSGVPSPVRVAFMAHLDTADLVVGKITKLRKGASRGNGSIIHTDGRTTLGADDRAGVTVLLHMASMNVPGLYCLFAGEEVGCIGSRYAADTNIIFENVDCAISFDRKGNNSIITHQCGIRTCSQDFSTELALRFQSLGLSMTPDNTGTFTDSIQFCEIVPECTNISVGYDNAHSNHEYQDIDFLEKLCVASRQIKWHDLPVTRVPEDPSVFDLIYKEHPESVYTEGELEEDHPTLEKMRCGTSIGLEELYGFVTEEPFATVEILNKLLRGYHPSCL